MMTEQSTTEWAIAPDNTGLPEILVHEDVAQAVAFAPSLLLPCFPSCSERSSEWDSLFTTTKLSVSCATSQDISPICI